MHWWRLVLAALFVVVGGVWMLQGAGILPGSFMTGQRVWLVIGTVLEIAGLALGYLSLRPERK